MRLVKYKNSSPDQPRSWWVLSKYYDNSLTFNFDITIKIEEIEYAKDSDEFRQHLAEAREKERMWEKLID